MKPPVAPSDMPEDDDFANAVFVLADEPEDAAEGSVRIARTEFELCAPEPLRLVVLLHWRSREQHGQPRSADAIWATMRELGIFGSDGESPLPLEEVTAAAAFLDAHGLISVGGEM